MPGEVEITFANGSVVRMEIETPALEVRTPYGLLKVPAREIKQIEFGVHYSEDIEKQIDDAMAKLNADNVSDREAAASALLKLGADAYPAVFEVARNSVDLEAAKRAKAVLQALTQKVPQKNLRSQYLDSIVTPTFTIAGRIVTPTIKAKTEYFGDVQLKVAKLRWLRAGDTPTEASVFVDAAKYATQDGDWLDTKITIDARTKIAVSASGTVNLRPNLVGLKGGGTEAGPNGYPVPTAAALAKGTTRRGGQLLGRVGENGPAFLIGESYEGTPGREGKLYLQIVPSQYNPESTGGYQVKIAVK
jgi:hypothetical protein